MGFAVLASCTACTSTRRGFQRVASDHLAETATSYNLAVEQSQDEMLLLNVIRAQDNYPLYLTDVSKVTGTVKADINLGLKIPLLHAGSGGGTNDYFAMPSVDYSSSPAMDVNLLNQQDFTMGFLTPIPTDLFAYYWDQGWPSELLLYLLVLRVDEYQVGTEPSAPLTFVRSLYNQPDTPDPSQLQLQGFATWVHGLVSAGRPLLCSDDTGDAAVGPPLDAKLDALDSLVSVAKEGLRLRHTGPGVKPEPPTIEDRWQLTRPRKAFSLAPFNPQHDCEKHGPAVRAISSSTKQGAQQPPKPLLPSTFLAQGAQGTVDVLTLRSPEGVLYYLGQLARLENLAKENQKRALLIHVCDYHSDCLRNETDEPPIAPLFVALDKQEHGSCPGILSVRSLDGSDYLIPKGREEPKPLPGLGDLRLADASQLCSTGQTMHALVLLSQLISLQKTAKDFTTTSTVKVLGQ